MKFTEEKLEQVFTELLGQEGFPDHLGFTMGRKFDEVYVEIFEQAENFKKNKLSGYGTE